MILTMSWTAIMSAAGCREPSSARDSATSASARKSRRTTTRPTSESVPPRNNGFPPHDSEVPALVMGFPRPCGRIRGCRGGKRRRTTAQGGVMRRGDAWRPGPGTRVEYIMRLVIATAVVLGLSAIVGVARAEDKKADPTGTWKWEIERQGNKIPQTLKLKLDGDKL